MKQINFFELEKILSGIYTCAIPESCISAELTLYNNNIPVYLYFFSNAVQWQEPNRQYIAILETESISATLLKHLEYLYNENECCTPFEFQILQYFETEKFFKISENNTFIGAIFSGNSNLESLEVTKIEIQNKKLYISCNFEIEQAIIHYFNFGCSGNSYFVPENIEVCRYSTSIFSGKSLKITEINKNELEISVKYAYKPAIIEFFMAYENIKVTEISKNKLKISVKYAY